MAKRQESESRKRSKDRKENDGIEDLQKVLGDQLAEVQLLLRSQHERAATLAAQHAEARQRAEARNSKLQEEVQNLRQQLADRGAADCASDQGIASLTSLTTLPPLKGSTSQTSDRGARVELEPLPDIFPIPSATSQSRGSIDSILSERAPPRHDLSDASSLSNNWLTAASCEVIAESSELAKPPAPREFAPQPNCAPPELKDSGLPGTVAFVASDAEVFEAVGSVGNGEVNRDFGVTRSRDREARVCFHEDSVRNKDADGNREQEEGSSPRSVGGANVQQRLSRKSLTSPNLGQPTSLLPLEPLQTPSDLPKQGLLMRAASNFLKINGNSETKAVAIDDEASATQEPKPVTRKSMSAKLGHGLLNVAEGVGSYLPDRRSSHRQSVVNARQAAVFADAAAMKERVRQAIGKTEYNVTNFYKEEGVWQVIARSVIFEQLTLLVIAVNSLWIAIDADLNPSPVLNEAPLGFQITEHSFAMYFFLEWLVRFMSFQEKRQALKDSWFVFDSCLVAMMAVETWFVSILIAVTKTDSGGGGLGNTSMLRLLRLLRLTRMARMARLLRAMPELMIMIKGMTVAMRSVLFTLFLLLIIIYIFSLVFRQLTDGLLIGEKYFRSIPDSMITLLLQGTLPDLADLIYDVAEHELGYAILLLVFILFATLTVMNMLVGVLCEVVSVVSSVEKEQLVVTFVKTKLQSVFNDCVGELTDRLGKTEFQDFLGNAQAAKALHEVGVDVVGLMEITDFLFKDGRTLDFPNFMEMLLELRGTNTATVKHIVDLQRFVHLELRRNQKDMVEQVAALSDLMAEARTTDGRQSNKNAITKIARLCSQAYAVDDDDLDAELSRGSIFGNVEFSAVGARTSQQSVSTVISKGAMQSARESRRRQLSRQHR